MHDRFKLIYAYLKEGDKVCECYSCLKMVIQAHLHVGFFTIFYIKSASLKRFYLSLKLAGKDNFLNKKVIMTCLAIKIFAWNFCNSQFKKYNCNSTHSYNRKIWVDIPSYIIFLWFIAILNELVTGFFPFWTQSILFELFLDFFMIFMIPTQVLNRFNYISRLVGFSFLW